MAFDLPPPPTSNDPKDPAFRDWFYKLKTFLGQALDLSNVTGVLDVENGGTGTSDIPANGEILIGNGTDYTLSTLTAGTNITITNGPGTIEIDATGGGSTLNNIISVPTTIPADTSYPVIQYLTIEDTFTVEGNVMILDGMGGSGGGGSGSVTDVSSANADLTVASPTTTPVITVVQAPALRSATTTVDVSSATAPTSGQVLTATSSTAATWQSPASAGTYPKFSVYNSGTQAIPAGTLTLVTWDTETFDTNNNFASNRFTPTVAGYYQINAALADAFNAGICTMYLRKNGVTEHIASARDATTIPIVTASWLVFLNGSTDYVEIWSFNPAAQTLSSGKDFRYFQGFRVD